VNTETELETREHYRREAMGAFAHEVRTPLTSIRMVMELARRQGTDGQLVLDVELAGMLASSVDDLQRLADDLQETSRLERGLGARTGAASDLAAAVAAAADAVSPALQVEGDRPVSCPVPCDAARLVRALSGFIEAANRMGDGSGTVRLHHHAGATEICLSFASGTPGGERRAVAADSGFGFFRARQFVLAMAGSVDCERSDRFVNIDVTLPVAGGGTT
jgi:signal transduction histidine kinase